MEPPAKISFRRRCWLLLAAWVVAAVATVFPHAGTLVYGFLFPYGIMALFVTVLGLRGQDAPHYLVGWVAYFVLTVSGLVTAKRVVYFWIYAVLCVLLVLNVIGCHMMMHGYPRR
jgi:hypothetical protein